MSITVFLPTERLMSPYPKRSHRVGATFLLSFALLGCRSIGHFLLCVDSTQSSAISPGGRYIAEVTLSDCSATAHATVVSVRRNGLLAGKENVFVVYNGYPIKLSWEGDKTLVVACGNCYPSYTYSIQRQWNDVQVRYNLPPPPFSSAKQAMSSASKSRLT
jgi:hypothetical protein